MLELLRQVAWKRITSRQLFFIGRIHPGMQMSPDLALAILQPLTKRSVPLLLRGNRKVNGVKRLNAVALQDPLSAILLLDVADLSRGARERLPPIEFFLRVDDHHQPRHVRDERWVG